ncbi:FAD-binding oxidoreductase [Ruegeria pomeroyi]|uniref:FAD-binding oxidoreductase n=1 Tax=Ruegeria pomeroyi TaxID=89184 RepID=A0A9Q3WJZ6_9RHOB|nr:FAD-binding oxidoreductase [Ruegeria pomeroyi]MCE8537309.1 FAD-binding oxidoreductase [Ruegeria pomeroyi]
MPKIPANKERSFWGWGRADVALTQPETALIDGIARAFGRDPASIAPEPKVAEFELRAPRVTPPASLAEIMSDGAHDRLSHSFGKSTADNIRMVMRHVPEPVDLVAFPKTEDQIAALLDWAGANDIAVIPYGGGSSVCGGVEPDVGPTYRGTVCVDMQNFDSVLEVDSLSRAARIQAGIYGPALEEQLRPHGLTLRFFPQSFEFSTLGGWIATRAGGHYATLMTHIDDLVEATRMVTPAGIMETRRLPGSGAGISGDRLVLGSEGNLGLITEAWMRLQDRPRFRASASVRFDSFFSAAKAVRALSQSGLYPTNCRLLDEAEVAAYGIGDGKSATLVLGFESADHALDPWMERALELMADHGGRWDTEAVAASLRGGDEHLRGAAGAWRESFIRMPYYRDRLTRLGVIVDTFESAITWDRFEDFYRNVMADVGTAIKRATGKPGRLSCRFTHVYPDGPAPYFTFYCDGGAPGDMARALEAWRRIKQAANAAVTTHGGTVTHHHAVGRDHRGGYEAQSPALMRAAIAAMKSRFDPAGILNPGALIDPENRQVGRRGVLMTQPSE